MSSKLKAIAGARTILEEAMQFQEEGDLVAAEANYRMIIDSGYRVADVLPILAGILALRGADDEALAMWDSLLAIHPAHEVAHHEMGLIHSRMLTTLVMIEAGAIAELSPVQVADYATLRLLAPTGEIAADSAAASQTILSLFAAPEAAPNEMTRIDRAYLRSLYTLPRTAFASEVLDETVEVAAK